MTNDILQKVPLLIGCLALANQAHAVSTPIVEDSFTQGSACASTLADPWFVDEGSASRACCPGSSTDSCLLISDTSASGRTALFRSVTAPAGTLTVEYRVRVSQTNARVEVGSLVDSTGRQAVRIYFHTNGTIRVHNGATDTDSVQSYSANTWYRIRYVVDLFEKRFNLYVDDVLRRQGMRFFDEDTIALSKLSFTTDATAIGSAYVDDVKISEGGVRHPAGAQFYDFNADTTNSAPPGWTTTTAIVVPTPSTTDKSVRLNIGSTQRSATRTFPAPLVGRVTAVFAAMASRADRTVKLGCLMTGANCAFTLSFDKDGVIRGAGEGPATAIQPYAADRWYRFKINADTSKDRVDVHIDGELKAPDLAIASATSSISAIKFEVATGTNGYAYFDDVSVVNDGILQQETFGSTAAFTGNPIGGSGAVRSTGGEGYDRLVTSGTRFVNAQACAALGLGYTACLRHQLQAVTSGGVAYVDDSLEIDLCPEGPITTATQLKVKSGVTLASGRGRMIGRTLSPGARLYCDKASSTSNEVYFGVIEVQGTGARITGLRIDGTHYEVGNATTPHAGGIYAKSILDNIPTNYQGPGNVSFELDNNELYGWYTHAVWIQQGYVHHNYFHDNQRYERGYGVAVSSLNAAATPAVIIANLFDDNRHSIACQGLAPDRYIAMHNTVLESRVGHAFDMHKDTDPGGCEECAGDWVTIRFNTLTDATTTQQGVHIRGVPLTAATIDHNWFYTDDVEKAIQQKEGGGEHMNVGENQYGTGSAMFRATDVFGP